MPQDQFALTNNPDIQLGDQILASVIPPISATTWLLQQLYQQGAGVANLAVDSSIVKQLNSLDEPSNVPYLVLAGENLANHMECDG